ncbi:DUF3124 domain-containing protein [Roseibium hamelinense]|nr:DUF3124 domain-containing protein [Roseibium hamelinense]
MTAATVYVPAYSQVNLRSQERVLTAATLVFHNVDDAVSVTLTSVDYYDHTGKKLKAFVDAPVTLQPFASQSYLVPVNDQTGGIGANFVLTWQAESPTIPPLAEAVMMGGSGTQAFSFASRGQIIKADIVDEAPAGN